MSKAFKGKSDDLSYQQLKALAQEECQRRVALWARLGEIDEKRIMEESLTSAEAQERSQVQEQLRRTNGVYAASTALLAQAYHRILETAATGGYIFVDLELNGYYLEVVELLKDHVKAMGDCMEAFEPVVPHVLPGLNLDQYWEGVIQAEVADVLSRVQHYEIANPVPDGQEDAPAIRLVRGLCKCVEGAVESHLARCRAARETIMAKFDCMREPGLRPRQANWLVETIDRLLEFVHVHDEQLLSEDGLKEMHALGVRMNRLAVTLELTTPDRPVYYGYRAQPDLATGDVTNPTWPGSFTERGNQTGFLVNPSDVWTKQIHALRQRAKTIAAQEGGDEQEKPSADEAGRPTSENGGDAKNSTGEEGPQPAPKEMSREERQKAIREGGLASAVVIVYALRDLHLMRYYYPQNVDAEEAASLEKELADHLTLIFDKRGYEGFKAAFSEGELARLPPAEKYAAFAVLLLLWHPDYPQGDVSEKARAEGVRAALTKCEQEAAESVRKTVARIQEIQITDCRIPHPANEPTYQEPRRFLQLLREYWDLAKQIVLHHMHAPCGFQPHPLLSLLTNLRLRTYACFEKLASLEGASDAQSTVKDLLDTILSGEPDTLQVADEWTTGQMSQVEEFLEQTRLQLGSKAYPLTREEQGFLQVMGKAITQYEEQVKSAWARMMANVERSAKQEQVRSTPVRRVNTAQKRNRAPVYHFGLQGNVWRLVYDEETGLFSDRVGLRRIATLLVSPNAQKPIPAIALAGAKPAAQRRGPGHSTPKKDAPEAEFNVPPNGQTPQPMMDGRYKRDAWDRIQEINKEIDEANSMCDDAEVARLEQEKNKILTELKKATGLGGRDRALGPASEMTKAANAVSESFRALYKTFRDADPAIPKLAEHLEQSIKREENAFAYRPGPHPPDWQF